MSAKGVDPIGRIDALKLSTQHIVSRGSLPMTQLTATGRGSHAAPRFELCLQNEAWIRQMLPKFRHNSPKTMR
jgi:hypothetical protein